MRLLLAGLAAVGFGCGSAGAHHSFAAFFDPEKMVSVTGTITSFSFKNPHGIIAMGVKDKAGKIEQWRAETNAPVVLMRRGWDRESVKPGETVTLEGWPSRDGKPYLRLRRAVRADGTTIGVPFGTSD